jgi:hypothetical protein
MSPIMMLIWAEVVFYYDDMHDMSFSDVLRDFVRDILICLWVLMGKNIGILLFD